VSSGSKSDGFVIPLCNLKLQKQVVLYKKKIDTKVFP
jgi:hypothetical protein